MWRGTFLLAVVAIFGSIYFVSSPVFLELRVQAKAEPAGLSSDLVFDFGEEEDDR